LPVSQGTYGLIHFDFELDNIVWAGDQAKVLDFDECSYSWFAADIIYALSNLFDDNPSHVDLKNPSLQSFVQGYRSQQALPDETLGLLPLFLSFHNLLTFTKLIYSRKNFDKTNSPEWTQQLDKKLENKLEIYRASFALFP
jgi:Ser/Thr protein kinase RdoA (MazF antagonist)